MEAEQDAVSVEPPERVAVHKVVVPETKDTLPLG